MTFPKLDSGVPSEHQDLTVPTRVRCNTFYPYNLGTNGNWADVTETPTTNVNRMVVRLSSSTGSRFFRLIKKG